MRVYSHGQRSGQSRHPGHTGTRTPRGPQQGRDGGQIRGLAGRQSPAAQLLWAAAREFSFQAILVSGRRETRLLMNKE